MQEKFIFKRGKPWKIADQINLVQDGFRNGLNAWLDDFFKGLMPEVVYGALLARLPMAQEWMAEQGYNWRPIRLRVPSGRVIILEFGLFRGLGASRSGTPLSKYCFTLEHDGTFDPVKLANWIYNSDKGRIVKVTPGMKFDL